MHVPSAPSSVPGSQDTVGAGVGSGVGDDVGELVGRTDGNGVGTGDGEVGHKTSAPSAMGVLDVISQLLTPLERAWTWVGTSPHHLLLMTKKGRGAWIRRGGVCEGVCVPHSR